MTEISQALRAGLQATPAAAAVPAPGAVPRRVVVAGAAGPLGGAVLERLLAGGGFTAVATLVVRPLEVALRGLEAWAVRPASAVQDGAIDPSPRADTAVLVFDREHGTRHGREAAFYRPAPAELPRLGAQLLMAGVRRLVVVMPHAPALLPQALRAGLASLDEQALAGLGFEHLVIVRPTRLGAGQPDHRAGGLGHRVARALISQLHWMVPQREQPLRAQRVAQFVADLVRALPGSLPGTRVVPPELLWDWAQPAGGEAVLTPWLHGGAVPAPVVPPRRW